MPVPSPAKNGREVWDMKFRTQKLTPRGEWITSKWIGATPTDSIRKCNTQNFATPWRKPDDRSCSAFATGGSRRRGPGAQSPAIYGVLQMTSATHGKVCPESDFHRTGCRSSRSEERR